MPPILKDWLENLGCLLPIGFFSFCMAFIIHWVTTESGPARILIIWQARLLNGQFSPKLTMAAFILPALLGAWLISLFCHWGLRQLDVQEKTQKSISNQQRKVH